MQKTKILAIFLLFLAGPTQFSFAQSNQIFPNKQNQFSFYKAQETKHSPSVFFTVMSHAMGLDAESVMEPTKVLVGEAGMTHHRFLQVHQGIPIYGNQYILHEKDGVVQHSNGRYNAGLQGLSPVPQISTKAALLAAKMKVKSAVFAEEQAEPVLFFIEKDFPQRSQVIRLAYQVDLMMDHPFGKHRYFIDAINGKVLADWPLIIKHGVPSTVATRYYGTQSVITDSISAQRFLLQDPTRSVMILDGKGAELVNKSSNWTMTADPENKAALDAHYCTSAFHDLLKSKYAWTGIDGNGGAMISRINANDAGGVNAFWDGFQTNYGRGDCINGPLTTHEVIGHELMHGVIQNTSNLTYARESGAINESLADIFGKTLEYERDSVHFDWRLGHSFALIPDFQPFRVLNDPKTVNNPAMYKGEFWEADADVHTNSSIGNLWFSMLKDGKTGINEAGESYNVLALGIPKVAAIVFETNKAYFTESSLYSDFYAFTLQVAENKYGPTSIEVQSIKEAWKAVGVGQTMPSLGLDLALENSDVFGNFVCTFDTFAPVTVTITNTSSFDYLPQMGAVIEAKSGALSVRKPLDQAIKAKESIVFSINDWLLVTAGEYEFVTFDLDFDDEDATNNNTLRIFEFPIAFVDDIALDELFIDEVKCFSDSVDVLVLYTNESCEKIASGTNLTLQFLNVLGQVRLSIPFTLSTALESGGFGVRAVTIPTKGNFAEAKLLYAADPNRDNNTAGLDLPNNLAIETDYLQTFEGDFESDNRISISNPSTVSLVGTTHLATTGTGFDEADLSKCPDPASIFGPNANPFYINTLRTCLDFSNEANIDLDFDLRQYRNNINPDPNDMLTSMSRVAWSGSSSGDQVILGQTEGAKKHHTIGLPVNFKGQLNIEMYTVIGDFFPDKTNLNKDDFQLLDNFAITKKVVSTNTPLNEISVSIAPNPTTGEVLIQSASSIKYLQLQHLNGQVINTFGVNFNTYKLDMQGLMNGFYLVRVQMSDGQVITQKVVLVR
jgi:bacillolysin